MLRVKYTELAEIANVSRLNESYELQTQKGKPIYYLLPSNKWLQEARKRRSGIAFKTFDDLADMILRANNIEYFPVSEMERTLFFQELLEKDNKLSESKEVQHKAKAYAQTYGQLKRLGLTLDDLPSHFQDMKQIFHLYETEWVKKKQLLDPENRIHEAVAKTNENEINIGGIVIDGYMDFSTVQYMVINYFAKRNFNITVYLPYIPQADILKETIDQLTNLGFIVEDERAEVTGEQEVAIEIYQATTIKEEIHGVLSSISKKRYETAFSDIGIILADERNYEEAFINLARQYQIPVVRPEKKQLKDSLLVQLLFRSILRHHGHFESRWDRLDIVDSVLRLLFLKGTDYISRKRNYIQSGALVERDEAIINTFITYRQTMPTVTTLHEYIQGLCDMLERTKLPMIWREQLLVEENTEILKQLRFEWKAYEAILATLTEKHLMLENDRLRDLQVHDHTFADWALEALKEISIYEERAPISGIQLYSFRDVALFKGTDLYILGMNEGTFPKGHKLSGYFQESDLRRLPVPYAKPTQRLFRQKDDAFFKQLYQLATRLSFSYVVGVDPHNPYLPSTYLEQYQNIIAAEKYSATDRLNNVEAANEQDYLEKVAYQTGLGKTLQELPEPIQILVRRIEQLEVGQEHVSDEWSQKLKQDKLSVTMLESYAACPFKYAFERILKVEDPLNKQSTMDFRELGSMLHTIIEKFYKQLNLIGKPFATFTTAMKDEAEKILLDIFEEQWLIVENQHGDFSKLQLSLEKEQWLKKLKRWWIAELEHFWENPKLSSMHLFRLEEPIELNIKLDDETTITLSGKVDRIDIDENGFVVYDYKSGKASLLFDKEVRPGLKLQLPLYLVAMEERLATGHYQIDLQHLFEEVPASLTAHGASYISLQDPKKRASNSVWREEHFGGSSAFRVHHKATKEETLQSDILLAKYELRERLKHLWEGSTKDFSVKPLNCFPNCSYKTICRVTQEQIEEMESEWK